MRAGASGTATMGAGGRTDTWDQIAEDLEQRLTQTARYQAAEGVK
jgi:hypothetical protein